MRCHAHSLFATCGVDSVPQRCAGEDDGGEHQEQSSRLQRHPRADQRRLGEQERRERGSPQHAEREHSMPRRTI